MAITPFPTGVGGTLFGGGGGDAGADPTAPVKVGGGKDATHQNFGSPHAGVKATLSKGEPMSRAMGHYGKGHSFAGLSQIRGGTGAMRRTPLKGGMGPGKMGEVGPSGDYSMKTE